MDKAAIRRAGERLAQAFASGERIDDLAGEERVETVADAYGVQAAMLAALGAKPAGWKVGASSQRAMQKYGFAEPFCGRILADGVHASPATLRAADFTLRGLETEFAFRMTADLPAAKAPFTYEQVAAAAGELVPAIEVIEARLKGWPDVNTMSFIADNAIHGCFVTGEARRDWRDFDLGRQTAAIRVNGTEVNRGSGADVLGDPVNALVWLANFLPRMGQELKAGEVVTTGTAAGVAWAKAGDEAVSDFGPLGTVRVRFT